MKSRVSRRSFSRLMIARARFDLNHSLTVARMPRFLIWR